MKRYCNYYRVSTKKQEVSGLGLEDQQLRANALVEREEGTVVREFTEIEGAAKAGKSSERPVLKEAIAFCRSANCILVIAKLDRLARNVAFTAALMESGLNFICCDIPTANRLTIHILAAVAEEEARLISERTKAALARLKARGVPLGSARPGHWDGKEYLRRPENARQFIGPAVAKKMDHYYSAIVPTLRELREKGMSQQEIVEHLNALGHRTRPSKPGQPGNPWNQATLSRVIRRYGCDVQANI